MFVAPDRQHSMEQVRQRATAMLFRQRRDAAAEVIQREPAFGVRGQGCGEAAIPFDLRPRFEAHWWACRGQFTHYQDPTAPRDKAAAAEGASALRASEQLAAQAREPLAPRRIGGAANA